MIVVLGHWEDNEANPFSGRLVDAMRWLNQLVAFGVQYFVFVDDTMSKVQLATLQEMQATSPEPLAKSITIRRGGSLEDAIKFVKELRPTIEVVYVERRALITDRPVQSLKDFKHPKEALYVFGGDFDPDPQNPEKSVCDRVEGVVVSIDYPNVDKVALYAQEALSCILYDRYIKEG